MKVFGHVDSHPRRGREQDIPDPLHQRMRPHDGIVSLEPRIPDTDHDASKGEEDQERTGREHRMGDPHGDDVRGDVEHPFWDVPRRRLVPVVVAADSGPGWAPVWGSGAHGWPADAGKGS